MKILCFGDCNTWGLKKVGIRYNKQTRWTTLLATLLGKEYTVFEDGLFARTADSLQEEATSVKSHLYKDIMKDYPFDLIILSLGTADLMATFNFNSEQVVKNMRKVIEAILGYEYEGGKAPKIILTSVPLFKTGIDKAPNQYGLKEDAVKKSRELSPLYKELAESFGIYFFDTAKYIKRSDINKFDCIHFNEKGHKKFASAMANFIKNNIL